MNDESQTLAEVESAPAPEATATPDSAQTPEVAEQSNEQQEEKKFSQAEIDAMISKRLAREQRKWEREQAARLAEIQAKVTQPAASPSQEQFESVEAYAEALASHKAEELLRNREQQRVRQEIVEAYHEREEDARSKYEDFEQVAYNPKLPVTNVMAETIQASDIGPDIAYFLGSNPKEADRISRLSPFLQAKEIGKIEAKLADNPPAIKKTSSAPTPITPVTARVTGTPVYDTTDPRSTKTMTASQWIEAERQRQIKKLEAQRNR